MVPTHNTFHGANELTKYGWENIQYPGWWVAPTYGQAVKGFDLITQNFGRAIAHKRASQGQMSITFRSGGKLRFLSTERYENLRGEGVGFMVVDEAAFVPRAAWQEVLRPMLSDTGGKALFFSTPKGKNWFFEMWTRGQDPDQPDYSSYHFPTRSSPYIPDSEVEEAKLTLPADVFAQEYEAAFLDEAAGVFRGIADCIGGELEDYIPGHKYVIGWDIAKHTDWSVVSVLDTDHKVDMMVRPHLVEWQRFNDISYVHQMDIVQRVSEKYHAYVLLDSTGLGDPIFDSLTARGVPCLPYHFSSTTKQQLIQNLAVDIQNRDLTFPDIPVLRNELEIYQYEIGPTGNVKYSAPEGMHDDCVISLALADWAARHPAWMSNPIMMQDDGEGQISPI